MFQLTAIKAAISILICLLVVNKDMKHILIDSVDKERLPSLAFKSCQTTTSVFISFYAIKHFKVSTVGMVCSLTPLIACVLAFCMLGEKITLLNVLTICAVLASVFLVILGAEG